MLKVNQLVGFGGGNAARATGNDSFTKLLLHMDGADASTTFTDSSSIGRAISVTGDSQIDTAQSVFGGSSGLFDGAGDNIAALDSVDWNFGTADWTIDFRARPATIGTNKGLFDRFSGANDFFGMIMNTSNFLRLRAKTSGLTVIDITTSQALAANTQYHVAIVCASGTITIYINGVDKANGTRASSINSSGAFNMAYNFYVLSGTYRWNGHIDELRISKGIARWTTGFTPPTKAYS